MHGMADKSASLCRATPWREVIILCRKCGKKLDGGFGRKRKETLKTTLRQALREAGRRRDVRIMETSCMGICPKQGVTALNATYPGTVHVVPAGSNGEDALRTLLGRHVVADLSGVESA
jgi:predicted metal-binding protein